MRLLITGHDAAGKAVFSHAGPPPRSSYPGSYEFWSTKGPISVPDPTAPDAPAAIDYFPAEGETAFISVTVPPDSETSEATVDESEVSEEMQRYFEDPDDIAVHTTDTIDYVVIVSGRGELELDDGRKEVVEAGDCVVQRGTRHAWRNPGDEPLVLVAALIGARRR